MPNALCEEVLDISYGSRNMKCAMCGCETNMVNSMHGRKLILPNEVEKGNYCNECAAKLNKIQMVRQITFMDVSDQLQRMQAYKIYVKNNFDAICELIQFHWLKSTFTKLVEEADRICDVYDNYKDYLQQAFDILKKDYKLLPANQVHYGYSTFAADDACLFFMKYGKPIIGNPHVINLKSATERWNVIKELNRNGINNKMLIDVIPLDDIIYFQEKGDVQYSTSVSGGGSKGVSYSGAVLGGILFGTAGAVVGGMKGNKIDKISSEVIEHDNRYVVIRYKNDDGKTVERKAPYDYYYVFNSIIPEKEYSYVRLNSESANVPKQEPIKQNINRIPVEELKALKELLDMGIITNEDFEKKKNQLLGI